MHTPLRTFTFTLVLSFIGFRMNSQVVINEGTNKNGTLIYDEDGDNPSWIELYNYGAAAVSLYNYGVSDDSSNLFKWQMPNIFLESGQFLILFTSGKDRKPDNTIHHWEQPVNDAAIWKYLVPDDDTPSDWIMPGFDDSAWGNSLVSVGYGDDDDNTILPDGTLSIYLRHEFIITDTSDIANAMLSIDYDDGFIAYLNGNVIALNGFAEGSPEYDELSGIDHEAAMYFGGASENFIFDETLFKSWLVEGTNVFAVEVHNVTEGSSDLTARPFLSIGIKTEEIIWTDILPAWFPIFAVSQNLHTNFKINPEGESVYLTNAFGITEDTLFISVEEADHTVGCISDASPITAIFTTPTPGYSNSGMYYTGYAEGIASFNLDAGFYSGEQIIEIITPPGGELHYTLNGELPTLADPIYTDPISVVNTTVIKARNFDPSGILLPGKTATNTFFIDENISVPVVSITTNNNNLYGDQGIFDNWWTDWKKASYIEYFDSLQYNAFEQNIAIKVDGGAGGSRSLPQHSMRIELDNAAYGDGTLNYPLVKRRWAVGEYETFYLRNGSNMSNVLPYKDAFMVRTTEGTYNEHMAYEPIVVFLNGEYFGYYELRTKLDEGHFDHALGIEKDSLDLLTLSYWYGLILRTLSGSDTDFIQMRDYLGNYPTPEDPDFYLIADSILDLKNFTDYIAAETWMANYDWPYNNIKAWRDRGGENKWKYALIDVELGLGIGSWSDATADLISGLFGSQIYIEPLAKLLQNPIYHDYFVNRYADLMNSTFLPERTLSMEDSMYLELMPELPRQLLLWGYGPLGEQLSTFTDYRSALRNDFEVRSGYVRNQINSAFSLNGKVDITLECSPPGAGRIKISTLTIFDMPWSGIYFDGVPVQITAEPNTGYTFSHWGNSPFITDTLLSTFLSNISSDEIFTAYFDGAPAPEEIVVSEINYNAEETVNAGNWIELWNHGIADVNISGWKIKDADPLHIYVIPEGTILSADERIVVAVDTILFQDQHPEIINWIGPLGFGLDNSSETIQLFDIQNNIKLNFSFLDDAPWPGGADGQGRTMELSSPLIDLNNPDNWFDGCIGGSPGLPYSPCDEAIIFSEINYNSGGDFDSDDWVELRNISDASVDISGWKFMDDSVGVTHEFLIPDGNILNPSQNLVLAQTETKFIAAQPFVTNYNASFNFNLGNNGEWIRMYDENGILSLSVNYQDLAPWPLAADGGDYTLELVDSMGLMNSGYNWTTICPGGSPGFYALEPCLDTTNNVVDENLLAISLYPNPAENFINVYLSVPATQWVNIALTDINGSQTRNLFDGELSVGINNIFVDLAEYPSGIYFLKIRNSEVFAVQKFIKE